MPFDHSLLTSILANAQATPSLRILHLSNGPMLGFCIKCYSLMKDTMTSSHHPKHLSPTESKSTPLLVLMLLPPPGLPTSPDARDEDVPPS
ncbi:hypothetical protein V8E53_008572 [Lactarius tabidus]